MTKDEVERIEIFAKEIMTMLPKYGSLSIEDGKVKLYLLEKDFPKINEVTKGEPYTITGKYWYVPIHEQVGNVEIGGCINAERNVG